MRPIRSLPIACAALAVMCAGPLAGQEAVVDNNQFILDSLWVIVAAGPVIAVVALGEAATDDGDTADGGPTGDGHHFGIVKLAQGAGLGHAHHANVRPPDFF